MSAIRLMPSALLVCAAVATPVSADVTLRLKVSGGLFGGGQQGDSTEYRKGSKLRTDFTANGASLTTILDVRTGRIITLFHDRKEAEVAVFDSRQMSEPLGKSGFPEVQQSITPTAASRQIAGATCTVYNVKGSFPMPRMDMVPALPMVAEGTICAVKDGPGQADFTAFYRALAERAFVRNPGQTEEQRAAAKAMATIYRQMAEIGVPFATEMSIGVVGNGPIAETMKKENTYTTEVSWVSTSPIPDSMFEISADYKVIKR